MNDSNTTYNSARCRRLNREGKIIVMLAILLPALLAITGLVFDGGRLVTEQFVQQHAMDAAATAAAVDIRMGQPELAVQTASNIVHSANSLGAVNLVVNSPPASGPFAGDNLYVEVIGTGQYRTSFIGLLGGIRNHGMETRAVAGLSSTTPGAAVVVLDPQPEPLSIADLATLLQDIAHIDTLDAALDQIAIDDLLTEIPILSGILEPLLEQEISDRLVATATNGLDMVVTNCVSTPFPALLGGLEIEGLGQFRVDGSVHVNNTWGGVDERGERAGGYPGLSHAVSCMPLLSTTKLVAKHIRVVGGVDDHCNYLPFDADAISPLRANQLPVPDPFETLPVPSTSSDPSGVAVNVAEPNHVIDVVLSAGAVEEIIDDVAALLSPLLRPIFSTITDPIEDLLTQTTYSPGVYDSITVVAPTGGVQFEPGIYIIRGKNPITQISLCLLGPIQADGVMFYITDSQDFDASSGLPDAAANSEFPPLHITSDLTPSVVIAPLLPGGRYRGLDNPNSPFDDMLIFQERNDRRPIILEGQRLIGSGDLSGTIYAKWGHTLFVGAAATYDMKIVSGTARIVAVGNTRFAPHSLLPSATDVVLVE